MTARNIKVLISGLRIYMCFIFFVIWRLSCANSKRERVARPPTVQSPVQSLLLVYVSLFPPFANCFTTTMNIHDLVNLFRLQISRARRIDCTPGSWLLESCAVKKLLIILESV
jgi:hypothetical protein